LEGPRPVRRDELDDLADLLCQVFGFHEYYSRDRIRTGIRRPVHVRGSRVIAEDGRLVSHILTVYDDISIYGARIKVASIGGVSTHPEYRGRGFAGAILHHSLDEMIAAGAKILIVSGDRSLYRRHHCVPAGHVFEAEVPSKLLPRDPGRLTVRQVTSDDWPSLAPLYQAEPVRFLRSADFLQEVCFWWDCTFPDIWLIESEGQPLAYLSLRPHPQREGKERSRRVFEYAGSRSAMLDALPALCRAAGLDQIQFRLLGWDRELTYRVAKFGATTRPSRISGTLRLLDLPGLMRRLRPYLAARLPRVDLRRLSFSQHGDTCTFAFGEEQLQLDLSHAAPLVLGGADAPQVPGDLGRVLSAIFPLPLPLPGFNYV
jgi:predicted N-acetyltransferase YhbS